jgi:hypothetical protein
MGDRTVLPTLMLIYKGIDSSAEIHISHTDSRQLVQMPQWQEKFQCTAQGI